MAKNENKFENKNFFGREQESSLVWEYIEEGHSLKLAAPRGFGKSFFATEILRKAKEKDWGAIHINLEGCKNEIVFINKFISELKEEKWYKNFVKNLDKITVSLEATLGNIGKIGCELEWNLKKADIYSKLENVLKQSGNTIIVLNELIVFLNYLKKEKKDENGKITGNLEDVKFFLHWLRSLRKPSTKVRWIFCSSISIDRFIFEHGLSETLDDVIPFKVDELSDKEAFEFVKELLKKKEKSKEGGEFSLSDELIMYMLNKLTVKTHHYIELLFNKIYELYRLKNREINNNLVDDAFQEAAQESFNLKHMKGRLKKYYGEDKIYAEMILDELAKKKEGKKENHLYALVLQNGNEKDIDKRFKGLRQRLKDEGYIFISNEIWKFRCSFLREYWANNP